MVKWYHVTLPVDYVKARVRFPLGADMRDSFFSFPLVTLMSCPPELTQHTS